MNRLVALLAAASQVGALPLAAGTYFLTEAAANDPFLVVHAPGYDGNGGVVFVDVCRTAAAEPLEPYLLDAITVWNNLTATVANCSGRCWPFDEMLPPGEEGVRPLDPVSAILHELGHCIGLGHANWLATSFTNTKDAVTISAGADGIKGSRDDVPSPLPGSRVLHWFRILDNNPVILDGTVIDSDTYARAISFLPTGDRWPASANFFVAASLGAPNTQTVMMSVLRRGAEIRSLSADDVNTIEFARAGLDELSGVPNDADDYAVLLFFDADCTGAEIRMEYLDLGANEAGGCIGDIELVPFPGGPPNHYRVTGGGSPIVMRFNSRAPWTFRALLLSDFETGDTSQWSFTQP